jgi:hypothetical protein
MLKTAPPHAPRDVAKGRFAFDALGEVQYEKKAEKGKKEKWMRESRGDRSDRYAEYKGSISRLGHSGSFEAQFLCLRPTSDGSGEGAYHGTDGKWRQEGVTTG